MELVYLGKITSTHGIKGELKIKSNFEYKEEALKPGNDIVINGQKYNIKTYRRHKDYEMVTLDNYKNINDVLFLLKQDVYIDKQALNDNLILDNDLLTYSVFIDDKIGNIKEIFFASKTNKILRITIDNKEILVPYSKEFIKKINKKEKKIYIELIDGMIL
ncbi:MAG: 16S rRNA processing protein RimM [Bacilli bacterium]|nr:16S rRNA processing protein RimM [Bacilli bacterium]